MKLRDQANAADGVQCSVVSSRSLSDEIKSRGRFRIECVRAGEVLWVEEFDNLWTTEGMNDILDKYLAGAAYTAAWYIGLIDNASYVAGVLAADVMNSHAGWIENVDYSNGTRPAMTWANPAAAGAKTTSAAAAFTINGTATLKGAFVTTGSAKSGTTGILFAEKAFGATRAVESGDTLNVNYTASLS